MTTAKEKALKHVRTVCPELMELSLGCKLKVKDTGWECTAVSNPYTSSHWEFIKVAERKEVDNGLNLLGLEIIGHTPHLESYVYSVKKVGWNSTEDWLVALGSLVDLYDKDRVEQSDEFYKLYLDLVSDQISV